MYPHNTVLRVSPWVLLYPVPHRSYFTMDRPQLWDGRWFRAYMVFSANGMYHHGPAPVLVLTFPAFHPPFRRLNTHFASPALLLRLQHLHYLASHISVRYYAEDCLLSHKHCREDSDLPSRIVHSRSPERYVPSGQHLLLPARILITTCITLMY